MKILVNIFLILHLLMLLFIPWYISAIVGLVEEPAEFVARFRRLGWTDHASVILWIGFCSLSAILLRLRKEVSLVFYAVGMLCYLIPNLSKYAIYCTEECPPTAYLYRMLPSILFFIVMLAFVFFVSRTGFISNKSRNSD